MNVLHGTKVINNYYDYTIGELIAKLPIDSITNFDVNEIPFDIFKSGTNNIPLLSSLIGDFIWSIDLINGEIVFRAENYDYVVSCITILKHHNSADIVILTDTAILCWYWSNGELSNMTSFVNQATLDETLKDYEKYVSSLDDNKTDFVDMGYMDIGYYLIQHQMDSISVYGDMQKINEELTELGSGINTTETSLRIFKIYNLENYTDSKYQYTIIAERFYIKDDGNGSDSGSFCVLFGFDDTRMYLKGMYSGLEITQDIV